MAQYKLSKPHFLGNRWFAAGSVVDYEGAPSKHMVAADQSGEEKIAAQQEQRKRTVAMEAPQEYGEPSDPTWAPQTRPAFSVKALRVPKGEDDPNQATVTRVAVGPGGSAPLVTEPTGKKQAEAEGRQTRRVRADEPAPTPPKQRAVLADKDDDDKKK